MFLRRIVIQNFRSIDCLEVELRPGLNVLVGENNVGKTTVLDALRACLGHASAGADALRVSPDDRRIGPDGSVVQDPIAVDVYFADLSQAEQAEFIDALNYNPTLPETSTASIHFRWSFSEKTRRVHVRRWGGERPETEAPVPEDVLQGLPLTLLGALRDAVTAMAPGRSSRLGRLLSAAATDTDRADIEGIARTANEGLERTDLISRAGHSIRRALRGASGKKFAQEAHILTSEPEFERIVYGLQLALGLPGLFTPTGMPLTVGLRSNGLGYNNLLYIGTVTAELQSTPATQAALPLLLVEEPEAHLHPQLQTLLANFLGDPKPEGAAVRQVQTIVTTHSPTIAAHVPAETLRILHRSPGGQLRCIGLDSCDFSGREAAQLRRMFDVTRATLLFSKGVILVEGIAELLLMPVLARLLGFSLEDSGVSVVQVCGVDFKTIAKMFGDGKLEIPLAIVTDGDPGEEHLTAPVQSQKKWEVATPKLETDGSIRTCQRTKDLARAFEGDPYVAVFHSKVTLEHALAQAGADNPKLMCDAWHACYAGEPETFNRTKLASCKSHDEQVLAVWRGICLASPAVTKGAFAQALADELEPGTPHLGDVEAKSFVVPVYLEEAIRHAVGQPHDNLDVPEGADSLASEFDAFISESALQ